MQRICLGTKLKGFCLGGEDRLTCVNDFKKVGIIVGNGLFAVSHHQK